MAKLSNEKRKKQSLVGSAAGSHGLSHLWCSWFHCHSKKQLQCKIDIFIKAVIRKSNMWIGGKLF